MLDASEVEREENRLRDAVSALPDDARKRYYEQLRKRTKDPDTYATLNWFLVAGLHHFYLGKTVRGMINLIVFAVGVFLIFVLPPIGISIITVVFIVELWALFRSQIIVRDHNNRVSESTLQEVVYD
jgi:TM2 domain-containing membrane protein YozV